MSKMCLLYNGDSRVKNTRTTSSQRYLLLLVAVGVQAAVEVFDIANQVSFAYFLLDHLDSITLLQWLHFDEKGNELELLASSSVGIRRYDLQLPMPEVCTCNTELGASMTHLACPPLGCSHAYYQEPGGFLSGMIIFILLF